MSEYMGLHKEILPWYSIFSFCYYRTCNSSDELQGSGNYIDDAQLFLVRLQTLEHGCLVGKKLNHEAARM